MNNTKIVRLTARQALDSRGIPTVCANVTLSDGTVAAATVPSGASTGSYEAYELRDIGSAAYGGKGVCTAVENVKEIIAPELIALETVDQGVIDRAMQRLDGTENYSKLGANAVLAVSMAVAKAAAASLGIPLFRYLGGINAKRMPIPMMNILNGGVHAHNNLDIQEYMIVPVGFESFRDALRACSEIYHILGGLLKGRGLSAAVGDEGGYAPFLEDEEDAVKLILEAIDKAGYDTDRVKLALDAASSGWQLEDGYVMLKSKRSFTTDELISHWRKLCEKYPIISIEDGLGENDLDGWEKLTSELGNKVQLVGDDLFVTNVSRLEKGIRRKAANALLVKVNQVGTLTQAMAAAELAAKSGYGVIVSHRSGETEDTFIADIAVALNCGQIKAGAPCRSERVAKYNRLLAIEEFLGKSSEYAT